MNLYANPRRRALPSPQFRRLMETERPQLIFYIDDIPFQAMEGDTVLTAVLLAKGSVREADIGDGHRAGFCLMGACQDCWVQCDDGHRLRACSTPLTAGLRLTTPSAGWGA